MKLKDWFIQNENTIFTNSYRLNLKDMPLCTEGDLHTYSSINTTQWMTNLCMGRTINWWPDHMCSTKVNNIDNNYSYNTFYGEYTAPRTGATMGQGTYMNSELGILRESQNSVNNNYSSPAGYYYPDDTFKLMTQNANGSFHLCEDNELGQLPILLKDNIENDSYEVNAWIGMILFAKLSYKRYGTLLQDRYRLIYCPFWSLSYDYDRLIYYGPIIIDLCDPQTDQDHNLVYLSGWTGYGFDYSSNYASTVDAKVKILLMYDQFNPTHTYVPSTSYWVGSYDLTSGHTIRSGTVVFTNGMNCYDNYNLRISCVNEFSSRRPRYEGSSFTVDLRFAFGIKAAGVYSEQESRPIV